jgi:hypothetical protein
LVNPRIPDHGRVAPLPLDVDAPTK